MVLFHSDLVCFQELHNAAMNFSQPVCTLRRIALLAVAGWILTLFYLSGSLFIISSRGNALCFLDFLFLFVVVEVILLCVVVDVILLRKLRVAFFDFCFGLKRLA